MAVPTTMLRDVEVSRLVVGGNCISGFSHGSRDREMLDYFTVDNIKKLLRRCEDNGITTCFLRADKHVMRTLHEYWNEGGKIKWVAQSAPEMAGENNIRQAKAFGASAIYVHGGEVDDKFEKGKYDVVRKQIDLIHELGMPAGCASHIPDNIRKIVELGWDVDFFMICLYNIPGYRGQLSVSQDEKFIESDRDKALALFKQIDKPCTAYKIYAAGRRDPERSFREVCEKIKPIDLINLGMYPPDNPRIVEENVALAERYFPV